MISLVRKTLEIYLTEKRIITQSEFPSDTLSFATLKDAVFVTLYSEGRVIASSGRIQCKKENTLLECVDNTLLCLKDERFAPSLQSPEGLKKIFVRVDTFNAKNRRVLTSLSDLDISKEGIIILSQNLGTLGIVLPHMVHVGASPDAYFALVCQKASLDPKKLTPADYVLYGLTTNEVTDMV
jgi:AMMECR1 domain-containing protein